MSLLTIPATDRRVVRLLVVDVGLTALDRLREGFRRDELARWPALARRKRSGRAKAVIWTTTSALLALADAVTAGDIGEADATAMAIGIVRATRSTAGL